MRNRLLASVALCSVAVLAAGAPGVSAASRDVADSQDLVERAELGQRAVSLSHALADERDALVRHVATGRPTPDGGVSEPQRARVDRRVEELRAEAPLGLQHLLEDVPDMRQEAVAGEDTAVEVHEAYTKAIRALDDVVADTVRALPGRAENSTADALPDLGRATEHASATRGLLLAALAAGGELPRLTAAAQQAHLREQAALADFDQVALPSARDAYAETVTGTDVTMAERYLRELTDQPQLDAEDLALDPDRVESALTARVDRMRSMESSLATAEVARLKELRDDDVTALELSVALLGACLLLAVGVSVQAARSMARPLAVLRLGSRRVAADPVGEEPVAYTGRDDEFADVVRAVNRLRRTAVELHERALRAETDHDDLVAARERLADERERLLREHREATERLEATRGAAHGTFVHLALRTLGLVERQLAIIEGLEDQEAEPERLDTLFKLDHLATRMRRHSENLLLLAGAEHAAGQPGPVPLLDVLRAAISEIERYERVELSSLPPHARVSGFAADDVSHLVAELLDNATAFSPPDSEVQLSGWMLENGEVMLSVQDRGIGMTADRLAELNARLDECGGPNPPSRLAGAASGPEEGDVLGMGLYVVARLAERHGIRVQLREQKQGGVTAVVILPRALLPDRPAPGSRVAAAVTGTSPVLPGTVAEANSNTLPGRARAAGAGGGGGATADAADAAPDPVGGTEAGADGGTAAAAAGTAVDDAGRATTATTAAFDGEAAAPPHGTAAREAEPRTAEPVAEPHEHARSGDDATAPASGHAPRPEPGGEADRGPGPAERSVTDKGLPKRRPRHVATGEGTAGPRQGSVDAEELRRRLGGFQQGVREGYRDAAAETAVGAQWSGRQDGQAGATDPGGTDEEART